MDSRFTSTLRLLVSWCTFRSLGAIGNRLHINSLSLECREACAYYICRSGCISCIASLHALTYVDPSPLDTGESYGWNTYKTAYTESVWFWIAVRAVGERLESTHGVSLVSRVFFLFFHIGNPIRISKLTNVCQVTFNPDHWLEVQTKFVLVITFFFRSKFLFRNCFTWMWALIL